MNFSDAVKTACRKWLTIEGRASRSEYWWFQLFNILLSIAIGFICQHIGPLIIIFLVLYLYLAIVQFTLSIRRLHDTDKSGWWLLISLIPFIGGLILLYFFILPSDKGPNRFGS